MADDDGAAGKVVEALFKGAQRVDVDVVGGLVEQDDVTLLFQRHGKVQTVALTAGEHADFLFLVGAGEVELGQVGAGVDVAATHAESLGALADDLVDSLFGVEVVVTLVDVGHLDGLAHLEVAGVGLLLAHYQAEEGGLAGAVGTDDTHDAVGREHKVEVFKQLLVAERLCQAVGLDDLVAEARAVGDEDFEALLLLFLVFVEQLVVAVETGLTLCLTRLGCHAHPFELALEGLAALRGLLLLLGHALGLLVEPRAVVALPGYALAAVELEDPAGHVVEEVAVVGDGDDRAGILLQMLLQPVYRLGVEVVGGLVEQQHVGLLQQQAAQGHAAALATAEGVDLLVVGRALQGVHRALQLRVDVPRVGGVELVLQLGLACQQGVEVGVRVAEGLVDLVILGQHVHDRLHTLAHNLDHRLVRVELRLLLQVAHRVARRKDHLALIRLVKAGNDFQQRRFSRAVETDNANLGTIEKRQVNVF